MTLLSLLFDQPFSKPHCNFLHCVESHLRKLTGVACQLWWNLGGRISHVERILRIDPGIYSALKSTVHKHINIMELGHTIEP